MELPLQCLALERKERRVDVSSQDKLATQVTPWLHTTAQRVGYARGGVRETRATQGGWQVRIQGKGNGNGIAAEPCFHSSLSKIPDAGMSDLVTLVLPLISLEHVNRWQPMATHGDIACLGSRGTWQHRLGTWQHCIGATHRRHHTEKRRRLVIP